MSPRGEHEVLARRGFPRVSGDEPPRKVVTRADEEFSPRERG